MTSYTLNPEGVIYGYAQTTTQINPQLKADIRNIPIKNLYFASAWAGGGGFSGAISAGYKRAFSAIVDSNVTTIIAALILLNFDAGPVKSFAMNLIIGISSSMFTSLFVTRFYFTFWAKNPKIQRDLYFQEFFKPNNRTSPYFMAFI